MRVAAKRCGEPNERQGGMMLTRLKSAARWLRRVFSPSDSAWTAAAYALLVLWALLALSFAIVSDRLHHFAAASSSLSHVRMSGAAANIDASWPT